MSAKRQPNRSGNAAMQQALVLPQSAPVAVFQGNVDAGDAGGVGGWADDGAAKLLLQRLVAAHVVPVVVRCSSGGEGEACLG